MKKVAIITINDDDNYGNRLQNYAVQEILKKHGLKPETIYNKKNVYGYKYKIIKIKNIIKKYRNKKLKDIRYNQFMKFNKNIKHSKYAINESHIPKNISQKYELFFTGSDQVWNPTLKRTSKIDFLTFVPQYKRVAISASFGISYIPDKLKNHYKKNLSEIKYISVREDEGKEIIKELTGRKDIEVLIDPTMMLNVEEWKSVSNNPKNIQDNKKYILNYFLGNLSEERKLEIERVAKENDCEIVNIMDSSDKLHSCGPSEFIYLVENAFLVCTDSFHGSIFSILYQRPFIIFDRESKDENMNSRIKTLIYKFKLENREFKGIIENEQLKYDYNETYQILQKERQKFNQFIDKVLDKRGVTDLKD